MVIKMNFKVMDPQDNFFKELNCIKSLMREHFDDSSIQLNYWQLKNSDPPRVELYISHVYVYRIADDRYNPGSKTKDLATVRLDVGNDGLFFDKDQEAIVDLINRAKLELFR